MMEAHEPLAERWRRFRMRPREERRLILRAALLLPSTTVGLRCFGFRRCKELVERFFLPPNLPPPLPAELQLERAFRTARAVRSAELHGPARANCLVRSMTLWWMLRLDGVDGELRIGARKEGSRLEAHAWVELGGQVLNDGAEVHKKYALFDGPIAAGAAEPHAGGKTAFH
jgi:hypothetical protein